MTHLTKSRKTKSRRKLQLACFWTNFINKTLLGVFLVVPRESLDRSVVIVWADILPHMKSVSRASRLGYLLASFASSVMGSVLRRDFTLKNMITPAVLDAQMNLILSLVIMSVPGCKTSFFLETCCDIATKKSFITRLDHSSLLTKPSTWNCGTGRP